MDILFSDEKMKKRCTTHKTAVKTWGLESANKLAQRLQDLQSLSCLAEASALPGKFHALSGDRHGQFAMRLVGGLRLVITPANEPIATLLDGGIDLSKTTAIRVVDVEDYHD